MSRLASPDETPKGAATELDDLRLQRDAAMAALGEKVAEVVRLRRKLDWYEAHKRDDGSYDGELFGDLSVVASPDKPPESATSTHDQVRSPEFDDRKRRDEYW